MDSFCAESNGQMESVETEGESMELKGLDTYTNYSVIVSAYTRAGKGSSSAQVFCQTAEDIPSGPADIKAVTSGSSSVIVSWRPPSNPNGVIKKFTVYRREVINGEEVEVKESSVLSGPNYLELSSLEWNRRYDIWVKAATDVGYGASSVITSIILGRIGKTPYVYSVSASGVSASGVFQFPGLGLFQVYTLLVQFIYQASLVLPHLTSKLCKFSL
jgi:Down syndrome cell adhesion protein 1